LRRSYEDIEPTKGVNGRTDTARQNNQEQAPGQVLESQHHIPEKVGLTMEECDYQTNGDYSNRQKS
jgi:hypothetical protein